MKHRAQFHSTPIRHWRVPAALVLLLANSAAFALGLGELKLKSGPGQPLVAEIPVISADPAEMEHLTAQLASPDTFERVGLQRPSGLVRELNFAVALSDDGKPVIRVTSATPVTQPMLNFLVEVDWGQGRLVREYSALVNVPGTVANVSEPQVQAPEAAPSNTIARAPLAPVPEAPAVQPAAQPSIAPVPTSPAASAAPPAAPVPAPAVPRRVPTPSTHALVKASVNALKEGGRITVHGGQTLSAIAAQVEGGYSLDQTMLALLRANPDAFIKGNINLLKAGAVLKLPPSAELAQLNQAAASAMVRAQMADWRDWRQLRKPLPQPVGGEGTITSSQAAARDSTHAADAQARLEIAPSAGDADKRKGTTSGTEAGGKGDMLTNTPLQQAKEDLAARDAEVQQLRSQVADLEKIKTDQARLLALKNSDLGTAQHDLGKTEAHPSLTGTWLWSGLGLLLIGLGLGWLIARSRSANALPVKSRKFDTSKLPPAPAGKGSGELFVREPAPGEGGVSPSSAPLGKPTWHIGGEAANAATSVSLNPAPAGRERLELAIAYKDMGDVVTARGLLNEVIAGNDVDARDEAAQLLRDLG